MTPREQLSVAPGNPSADAHATDATDGELPLGAVLANLLGTAYFDTALKAMLSTLE